MTGKSLAFTERDGAVVSEVTRFGVMSRDQLMRLKFFASKTRANDRLKRLVDEGYDPIYGARQLRRTIQKHIEDPLAEAIVRGQVPESARIDVDIDGGNFVFREAQAAEAPLELAEH